MLKNPGVPCAESTDSFPGFVFPLTGKTQFQFNGTPYILSPGKSYTWRCKNDISP